MADIVIDRLVDGKAANRALRVPALAALARPAARLEPGAFLGFSFRRPQLLAVWERVHVKRPGRVLALFRVCEVALVVPGLRVVGAAVVLIHVAQLPGHAVGLDDVAIGAVDGARGVLEA